MELLILIVRYNLRSAASAPGPGPTLPGVIISASVDGRERILGIVSGGTGDRRGGHRRRETVFTGTEPPPPGGGELNNDGIIIVNNIRVRVRVCFNRRPDNNARGMKR